MKAHDQAPKKYVMFHARLLWWYAVHGRRDLPWRLTADPYAIYISEVMLQQTQVKTVLERFYQPFLTHFPTLKKLAAASEKEVLSAWQGLGYYSRARNLHKAAKQCGGVLPQTVEGLMVLPGIGRNTAHAIAAFAYHQPVAVMEANVKRVLCRIFALSQPTDNELWEKAALLLDAKNPFDYNQAMMDIGAILCTKRAPKCGECPASTICKGRAQPELYPMTQKKKAVPVRKKYILLEMDRAGHVHAKPRTTRFLQGMYHFTEMETKPRGATKIGDIEQQYSHFTLMAEVYLTIDHRPSTIDDSYTLSELNQLPMSMAEKKILKLLAARGRPLSR